METKIDIYSDYVCPYCLLFQEVLKEVVSSSELAISWKAVELRPYPNPTLRPEDDYLPAVWKSSVYPLANTLKIALKLPTISPQPYTRLAHEGAMFAEQAGKADPYHARIFAAFFQEDRDIGDLDVLTNLATDIGLDGHEFREALNTGRFTAAHNAALEAAAAHGIHSVPSVFINGQMLPLTYDTEALRGLLAQYSS